MKNFSFKALVPHLIAIGIFLVVALIFGKPALESDTVLQQGDIAGWEGMSHQSFQYKETHGHFPLWATSMFSGMPAFQIAMDPTFNIGGYIHLVLTLGLPVPISFFFLACISFYFLAQVLRIRPWASIIGAIAFAYCSFDPIIISAGHNTQMYALAYAPALIGSVLLIFEKKYISGFVLTAVFSDLEFLQNHQQVAYYIFLILGIMGVAYLINWIRNKESVHIAKAIGLSVVGLTIGILINANNLYPVSDYAKESKRGGQLVIKKSSKNEKVNEGKTTGLSKDYAFQWSYGKVESMSLMFPGVKGYGLYSSVRDNEQWLYPNIDENSHVAKYMSEKLNVPEDQAGNFVLGNGGRLYWGDQPNTNGPVYLGAIICFLFIFGMFYLNGKHKWWLFAASLLGIVLAWGSNFAGFNYFVFDHLPFYNHFRVPTMAMVIPQILFPIMAALVLNKLLDNNDAESWAKLRKAVLATAAVFVIAFGVYFSSDFSKEDKVFTRTFNEVIAKNDPRGQEILDSVSKIHPPKQDNGLYQNLLYQFQKVEDRQTVANGVIRALRADRASLFMNSILMSLLYVAIAVLLIALFIKNRINPWILIGGLTAAAAIDLFVLDTKYLNDKSYENKDKYAMNEHPMSDADKAILKDTDPNFRVFNMSGGDPFQESRTSYFHKSIGGYHPAKLGIYDDLASNQLEPGAVNGAVVNMLNAKYIIRQQNAQSPEMAIPNPMALGNCWFVKAVIFVKGPVEEMKALDSLNTRDSAVVEEKFRNLVSAYTAPDSASTIKQTAFDNDEISYESNATGNHAAIFSEIYYKDWKAYLDGKPVDYFKANYVLRGMIVPAGKHTIKFKFEPKAYYTGQTVTKVTNWLLILIILAYIGWIFIWNKPRQE